MPLGMNEREVLPGVWAVAMTGESARLEYATKVLKFERMARLVFQNKLVRNLLDFVPGLNEVNQLGKLHWHLTDGGTGSRRFDHVVLEAPASGHAITLLRSPAIIHRASPPGPMRIPMRIPWHPPRKWRRFPCRKTPLRLCRCR